MFGNKWQHRWIVICVFICALLTSCQQRLPYRDIVQRADPQQPKCDKIIDDGFDQICVVYEMMEVPVPVEVFVEVPGPVQIKVVKEIVERIVKVPVVQVKVVEKIVEVPTEIEVPVEVIREVEKIVEVPGPVQIQIQKVNSFTGKIKIPPAYEGCGTTCHAVVKDNIFVQFDIDIDGNGIVDRSVKTFEHLD